jgi:transcriptional regulator with PAS, ATPase and Fis domain
MKLAQQNKGPMKDETKQKDKISKKLTGRKRNPESVNKTAEKLRGRKRPDVSERLLGKKKTPETIEKMKLAQQNKGPMKDETKQKIKDKRKLQVFTVETKEKLKGKIVCINKIGEIKKIEKEIFYSQSGSNEQKDWVFHNSNEGKKRKQN